MYGDKKLIALCTSRIYDQQVHGFIETFNEEIKAQGMRLIIFSINMDIYWEEDALTADSSVFNYIPYEKTDLIVIMDEKIKSHRIAERIIKAAEGRKKPVIIIDGSYPGCTGIRFDFKNGFEAVVSHMLDEHHITHPHFMAGIKDNVFSEERLQVFRDMLAKRDIPFDDSMVSYGEFWAEPAQAAARKLLERSELPDAIICANDIMAINVCDVLKEAGIDVPGQIMVSGFDGMDEAFLASPSITTANCDLSEIARKAAATVKSCLAGDTAPKDIYVMPQLMPSESCGCPRCRERIGAALSRFNDGFYRYQDDIRIMHNSITGMMSAHTIQEACTFIRGDYTAHASCVVNRGCFSAETNYFLTDEVEKEYCLLYDPSVHDVSPRPFDIGELIPHMDERLAAGYPLIVQSIDYMNKPAGYICYFFENYLVTNYAKTANVTEMVSMGFGGYIMMKYQRFLVEKVEEMYKLDALTGLHNRLSFQESFDALKSAPANQGKPLLVVMADLDRLKKINDNLGHGAGDQAIALVAHALRVSCPANALCVRFGGDEMLAFIPYNKEQEEALRDGSVEDGILESMGRYLNEASERHGFCISASCGFSQTVISEGLSAEKLIADVDEEMYAIKKKRHAADS